MFYIKIPLIIMLLSLTASANAGVIIGGSRLIYEGNIKEKSISVENPDSSPYLIQSWVEDADGKNIKENTPFIVTPPLFRLDGGQKNLLRIVRAAKPLPQDRESLFWLNIKSIPSASDNNKNSLQIAVRSRLKLIYRPDSLKEEKPEKITDKLIWKKNGNTLTVTNPSGYYMNFMYVSINNKKIKDGGFVAPHSATTFTLPEGVSSGDVNWKIINDYGGVGELHNYKL